MPKSSTTMTDLLPNPHPGEILLEEFLKPMGISQNAVAAPCMYHHAGLMKLSSAIAA